MAETLKQRIKDIKNKVDKDIQLITPMNLDKSDPEKQIILLNNFIEKKYNEIKKSSDSGKYLKSFKDELDEMSAVEARFVIEKSYDRYTSVLKLMTKYDDNFDDSERLVYESRLGVLTDLLHFLVENNIGEYR